jgi:hypothetical protein
LRFNEVTLVAASRYMVWADLTIADLSSVGELLLANRLAAGLLLSGGAHDLNTFVMGPPSRAWRHVPRLPWS